VISEVVLVWVEIAAADIRGIAYNDVGFVEVGEVVEMAAGIRSEEPFRVGLDITSEEGTATIVVDDDLDVHSVDVRTDG